MLSPLGVQKITYGALECSTGPPLSTSAPELALGTSAPASELARVPRLGATPRKWRPETLTTTAWALAAGSTTAANAHANALHTERPDTTGWLSAGWSRTLGPL